MDKKKMKKEAIRVQQILIRNFENLISDYKSMSDLDENETKDVEDFSHQGEASEMILNLESQLARAKSDLSILESLPEEEKSEVGLGSVIETDHGKFYISIPAVLNYGEEDVVGISTSAPIYKELRGKHKDDVFRFGENEFKILSVV